MAKPLIPLVTRQGLGQNLGLIKDFATRKVLEDVVKSVTQLQNTEFTSRRTESDNMPSDKQVNENINGVYIRLISKGFGDLVHTVKHGLGRIPQGCIFIRGRSSVNECVIEGAETFGGIKPATDTEVSFLIGDPAGSVVIALLL